jgi:D-inositol-3-phosphate glycosyltransferase
VAASGDWRVTAPDDARRLRVLLVHQYYHPYIGGAENLFKGLAEGLVRRGHHVRVVTTRLPGTPPHEVVNGVVVERVTTPRPGDRYFFTLLAIPAAVRRAADCDVVQTAPYNGAFAGFLAGRLRGRPVVFTPFEVLGSRWATVEPNPLLAGFYRRFESAVVTLPYDRYVPISRATEADLLRAGAPAERVSVVYPGIDDLFVAGGLTADGELRRLALAAPDGFLYVYFGRPGITKGVDILVRAVPLVERAVPGSRLAMILATEPRPQYERIRALISRLGLESRIALVPPVPSRERLARHLLDASCVVVPSLTEGFGLTAAEACALDLPVVATRAGSIPEVVSGRYVLVEPGSPEALAAGIVRAQRAEYDPWRPRQDFSWDRMVRAYEAIYRSVLERAPRPRRAAGRRR